MDGKGEIEQKAEATSYRKDVISELFLLHFEQKERRN